MSNQKEKGGCFVVTAFVALILIGLFNWLRPQTIPFSFLHFWKIEGSITEAIKNSWILFLWGAGITTIVSLTTRNDPEHNRDAEERLFVGALISAWAGVAEEICFRWLIFYGAIVSLKISNWLFFGWAGFGIFEWVYVSFLIPLANFATLDYLKPILFNGHGWAVGAAIITANGKFRDGHAYQGPFGWINSWFAGMFLFYLMFNYGLLAAIIVHFLYDLFIFLVRYVDAVIERRLGWAY